MIGRLFGSTARKRGNRARDAKDWTRAAEAYRRHLAAEPDDFAIWVQLGHVESEAGDAAAADAAYRTAAELRPDDADLLLCWGHARKKAGDVAQARALYERSAAADGNDAALREFDALSPSVEIDPVEAPAAAAPVGWIEHIHGTTIAGRAFAIAPDDAVELRHEGRVLARARLLEPRPEGGYRFKTLLALDGDAVIAAHRASDGAPLDNSPFSFGPRAVPALPRPAWAVRVEVAKPFVMPIGGEVALFVTHAPNGTVKPHVLPYLDALRAAGIATLLIVVADRPTLIGDDVLDAVAGAFARENVGYDFAAWAHAAQIHPEVYGASILYLLNDSVAGPAAGRLGPLLARIRASEADLVGLTESHEYRWHVQTFFLALKSSLLSSFTLHRFLRGVELLADKDQVIQRYELRFAEAMTEGGHRVDVMFPSPAALNPALHAWRQLLDEGFPFVKLLLLRGAFPDADITGWREVLADAGFDLPVIDGAIHAAGEEVPSDGDTRLLAPPSVAHKALTSPLKIAFYGPWNYDNGLGSAARGTIAALRRTDARLNLHPIKKPFHIHRPLAPPVDIAEFGGPADVAIVHLNPDSWFLLTDDQRAAIRAAKYRIGYWVWEMDHIPPAWRHDFSSVDRIWAPSRYCADLFTAQDEAPVDIVPHAVSLPAERSVDRARLEEELGVPADRRIILYVFDGSSYLVRKNPAALVRAFAASGLAERGWSLVLKTKHLMDRRDEGEDFRALAVATPGVVLIDRALPADELATLSAAADIYASPHCSEGFGLTVAEAMAAGKAVVATNFSGTADYLDPTTGYPVRTHRWRLDEDFGHYTKGGEWARIDEPGLTAALRQAATDVTAGDRSRGGAARARVAERLSYAAVGELMSESMAQLGQERRGWAPVQRIEASLMAGLPIEEADLGPDIRAVALAADGSPRGGANGLVEGVPADRDQWVVFAPSGSVVTPLFASIVAEFARARPDAAIFYGDDLALTSEQAIDQLRLKPELDMTLLAAQDYIGVPLIVRASALADLGGLDPERRSAASADLLFRAHAAGLSIVRIPQVMLATRGARVRAKAEDYRAMLEAQPSLSAYDLLDGAAPDSFVLSRRYDPGEAPPVTILVPTRRTPLPDGSGSYVERLLHGIAEADWPMDRLTVLVGDDMAGEPDWARRNWPFSLERTETPRAPGEPFNYAAKMNRLWRAAGTEQILFLNDDIQPRDPKWLRALMTFAVDGGVGGVGARLLFEDGSLQHAGFMPFGDCTAHTWLYRRRVEGTYQEWARVHREWSLVTGAVFATRRSLMEQVDGFDERFSLEFNDADLCLRLRALGYRIVYTPDAEMVHTEKASRGEQLPDGDNIALFLARWKPWLDNDPSWHPHLRRDRFDLTPEPEPDAWYR